MNRPALLATLLAVSLVSFWVGRKTRQPEAATRTILYYVDPMHPSYRSDKPGTAPDCGMDLEPVYQGETAHAAMPPGAVRLAPEKQSLVGLQTETVRNNSGPRFLRTSGRVSADENRVYRMVSATSGWVLEISELASGTMVQKDEHLATYYSNELRSTQTGYLGFVAIMDQLKNGAGATDKSRTDDSLKVYEEQLKALGMNEVQIQELTRTRQITSQISLNSPARGMILSRSISPQLRFEKGTEFYRIADLSKVWITGDLRTEESGLPRPGDRVEVEIPGTGRSLSATVSGASAQFDPSSRTFKIRLEADNPDLLLRPEMYVSLKFSLSARTGISVPQEAVLDGESGKVVYVQTQANQFEPRIVLVGAVDGDRVAIRSGLTEGERIVSSGTFLIDSESRMRAPARTAQAPQQESGQSRDPVCGMKISKAGSKGRTESFEGKTYFFCSDQCRRDFKKDPASYAGQKSGGGAATR